MALEKVGRYELLGEIGRGAMGVVYRARDPLIGRSVAVKTLRLSEFNQEEDEPDQLERFQNEIHAAGRLAHPNIVVIHDAGADPEADVFYITMEYVSGKSLQSMLEEKQAFPIPRVLRIMEQACRALEYAHANNIVHRDIKPANMLVGELDSLKITDFGTAKILERGGTQSGQIIGTPSYMAPEQVKGRPVDGRADVFALACILYELLTGERPFPGKNVTTVIYKIVHEEPIPPIELDSSIHAGLNTIILKGLAKDPGERYQSCQELLIALRNYRESPQSTAATVVRRVPVLPQTRPLIAGQAVVPPRSMGLEPDTAAQFSAAPPAVPTAGGVPAAASRTGPGTTDRSLGAAAAAAEARATAVPASVPRPAPLAPPKLMSPPAAPERKSPVALLLFLLVLAAGGATGYLDWPQVREAGRHAAIALGIAAAPGKPVESAAASAPVSASNVPPAGEGSASPPSASPAPPGSASPVAEFPEKLIPARDKVQGQLQKMGLSDRVQIGALGNDLVLTGQLTAAEHRALLHRLPVVLPGRAHVMDRIEVERGASDSANASAPSTAPARGARSWATPGKGALDVTSDLAGAQVSLRAADGSPVADCRTPCRFADLAPGAYTISVRQPGFPPLERPVDIRAGALGMEKVGTASGAGKKSAVGSVQVLSVPVGADILINGHSTGRQTPATIELPAGTYTVTLYRKGYVPFEQKVVVAAGKTADVQAMLAHP